MRTHFKKYKKHIIVYIVFLTIFFFIGLGAHFFRSAYAKVIYPNVYIGDINFGNKTKEEAKNLLNKKGQKLLEKGATISIRGNAINLTLSQYAQDPDLSRELVKFDSEKTVNKLYSVGRHPYNLLSNLKDLINVLFTKKEVEANIEFAGENLIAYLKNNLGEAETPAQNAAIYFEDSEIEIKKEVIGLKIDYQNLSEKLQIQLKTLQTLYITAQLVPDIPNIRKHEVEDRILEIEQVLARAPLTIKYNNKKWILAKNDLKKYLDFEKQKDIATLVISKEKSTLFFEKINKAINVPARNAKFKIQNGKVSEFQTSRIGVKFDEKQTLAALNNILSEGYPVINAVVETESPKVTTSETNKLGISSLLGAGISDFVGSPRNRIHNIKTGAKILNGLLIKPDEKFSLIKTLGEIDAKHGFKEELVIKQNKTIKEFGGGLCQIGTTVFRAAIDSGLPILERKNHSYRVSYYEPAGFDATIYNPSPDLKFTNDSSGHILIQTRVEGTKLIFEFWGKRDGRDINYTKPIIENITDAPPTKYIKTTELPLGEKKKIESAHKGADARFKYTVKYPDKRGEVVKTFSSHYRPWAEVWLVGATSTLEMQQQ